MDNIYDFILDKYVINRIYYIFHNIECEAIYILDAKAETPIPWPPHAKS